TDDLKMNVPPLLWAYKAQKRLANIGFDFKSADETLVKVKEEYKEFIHAIEEGNAKHIEHELGDMFFSLINYARHASINPDTALISSVAKFIDRVRFIEENSDGHYGRKMEELTMAEMDALWDLSKKVLKK
ncbi:MAG TPA: MazG nucleotide pyrophosphohydrolase domain-containing protein, partial [Candidatus Wallbacteria bacterium]|nr:MazG nucleotide pyrophosphohydrolase domain-containing protein [Candidatus Wallbacteria bacterium]